MAVVTSPDRLMVSKVLIRQAFALVLSSGGCGFSASPIEPVVAGGQRFFTLRGQLAPGVRVPFEWVQARETPGR